MKLGTKSLIATPIFFRTEAKNERFMFAKGRYSIKKAKSLRDLVVPKTLARFLECIVQGADVKKHRTIS